METNQVNSEFENITGMHVPDMNKATLLNLDVLAASTGTAGQINTMTFQQFYSRCNLLRQTANQHSWTRASVLAAARSAISGGFSFIKHPVFGTDINPSDHADVLKKIQNFFYKPRKAGHIQDMYTPSAKLFYSVVSFVLYGQCAWEILRDKQGNAIGYDVLAGVVMPNLDAYGKFNSPAYYYRAWNSSEIIEYEKPESLFFVTWPGVDFFAAGSTDYQALSTTVLPSDLYAATSYKAQFENSNAPHHGVWQIDPKTSDEDYLRFLALLTNRYTGAQNYGRNPLVIKGVVDFKETKSRTDDAPYLEGRRFNLDEISAVTGVNAAKMGVSGEVTRSNLREIRRDFHETTLRSIFVMLEEAIYAQILIGEFDLPEYQIKFNRPDFSTALEDATINTRYVQNGILSPNEVRQLLGRAERTDTIGSDYLVPNNQQYANGGESGDTNNIDPNISGGSGGDSELHPNNQPDGGSQRQFIVVRPPEESRIEHEQVADNVNPELIIKELVQWKNFQLRVIKNKRQQREFVPKHIQPEVALSINQVLQLSQDSVMIKQVFDILIKTVSGAVHE
jgi:HK97 family phage portal protein